MASALRVGVPDGILPARVGVIGKRWLAGRRSPGYLPSGLRAWQENPCYDTFEQVADDKVPISQPWPRRTTQRDQGPPEKTASNDTPHAIGRANAGVHVQANRHAGHGMLCRLAFTVRGGNRGPNRHHPRGEPRVGTL